MDSKKNNNDKPEVEPKKLEVDEQHAHSSDYAPYPKLNPTDVAAPPPPPEGWGRFVASQSEPESQSDTVTAKSEPAPHKSVTWSPELTKESPPVPEAAARTMPPESNPYVTAAPSSSSAVVKNTVDTVKDTLGRWGKKVGETTKKAEDLAGNVWQHLKTGPSVADAAMGRIAQSTKVLAEGGYEKVFQQTFETVPEEQLRKSFACYLSTSAGPVMGVLYLSTAKLAFCSDNPLSYKIGDQTEWSYYKVVIPLHQLKAVNPSVSKSKPVEKYIQVTSVDNHDFWFMAFVNYDSAIKHLQEALEAQRMQSV